jgi:lipopolysaccharide heptosyltransferase II
MKRFLITNPFGIGDVLFTTPVIRAIKDAYPDSFIGYWCNERVGEILKNNPAINTVFASSRGDLKKSYNKSLIKGIGDFLNLLHQIKQSRFEVSLDFSLDYRYSLIAKLAGIGERIGFDYKKRGRFLTHRINILGYNSKHVVEYYLELLKFIDIKPRSYNLELFVSDNCRAKSRDFLIGYGIRESELLIGFAPGAGASWGKDAAVKHWPAEKYGQLADKIAENFKAKILIFGDGSERPIADAVLGATHSKPINLTGKTSLEELAALISNVQVLVTNDGGPLHIASALGVKTVSIFGPVDEAVYGPYPQSEKHIVIKADLDCRPCYRNFRFTGCLNNRRCLQDITVDEVYSAVSKLILN